MINDNNPWKNMRNSSQRLVDPTITHDLYWITDMNGNYGLRISGTNLNNINNGTMKLRGISLSQNIRGDEIDLFIILKNSSEWQIFLILCQDLIGCAKKNTSNDHMVFAIQQRLKRWQTLLKQDLIGSLTKEKQMGLFGELYFLTNTLQHKIGIEDAIISWVGPELDKQDFILDSAAVEVKSYTTSKGNQVTISSEKQLESAKDRIYLIANALTLSRNGADISELVKEIYELLDESSSDFVDIFESKLIKYGYIPELNEGTLLKFIVDISKTYEVTSMFPKIISKDIHDSISQVKYMIDLTKCEIFEINNNMISLGADADD